MEEHSDLDAFVSAHEKFPNSVRFGDLADFDVETYTGEGRFFARLRRKQGGAVVLASNPCDSQEEALADLRRRWAKE